MHPVLLMLIDDETSDMTYILRSVLHTDWYLHWCTSVVSVVCMIDWVVETDFQHLCITLQVWQWLFRETLWFVFMNLKLCLYIYINMKLLSFMSKHVLCNIFHSYPAARKLIFLPHLESILVLRLRPVMYIFHIITLCSSRISNFRHVRGGTENGNV
jgi:hypothetical protein